MATNVFQGKSATNAETEGLAPNSRKYGVAHLTGPRLSVRSLWESCCQFGLQLAA